ncbi:MAG: hypothetical protein Kow0029_17840 [Candidatus Rifleibacteriota bacterium]
MTDYIGQTMRKTVLTIILAIAMQSAQANTAENKPCLEGSLKSSALVTQSEINADCLIKPDCSQALKNALSGIQLGHIPNPLGELTISKDELLKKLGKAANGLELPEKVVIKRQGAILKGEEVIARLKAICNENSDRSIEIDVSRIPKNIVLPGNLIEWSVKPNSNNRLGMRLFSLNAETDGGKFRQLIQVRVTKIVEAAQLTRLARPGELISPDMIEKKRVEVKSDQANLPMTYEEAVGKCLGRFKSPGTILRSSDLSTGENNICKAAFKKSTSKKYATRKTRSNDRSNWVVKPGEQVEYRFANGSLELSFPARAVDGGQIGDQISLINLKNHKRIEGIITEKGRVEYEKN